MTGAHIIGTLLRDTDPPIAPDAQIKLGALADNTLLPAVLIRTITSDERQPLRRGQMIRTADRVAVAVRAASYREQVEMIRRIRSRCAGITGDVAGAVGVSIATAGTGPDTRGPADSFEQTQDFRVSFDAEA